MKTKNDVGPKLNVRFKQELFNRSRDRLFVFSSSLFASPTRMARTASLRTPHVFENCVRSDDINHAVGKRYDNDNVCRRIN